MSGAESIPILEDMISFLMNKYQNNEVWVKSKRSKKVYFDEQGKEIDDLKVILGKQKPFREEIVEYEVGESSTDYYWLPTAAQFRSSEGVFL